MVFGGLEHLGVALGRHEFGVVDADFDDGARGHEDRALGEHEVHALRVEVRAVLDRVAARAECGEDARFAVAVGGDGETGARGLFDDRAELRGAVLCVQRVVEDAEHPARREHLDAFGSSARDEADGHAACVGAVGEQQRVRRWVGRGRREPRMHHVHGEVEEVAVARGLRDGGPGRVDVGSGERGLGDGLGQFDRVAAQVADRGEARQEDVARVAGETGSRDCWVCRDDFGKVQGFGS